MILEKKLKTARTTPSMFEASMCPLDYMMIE